MAIVTNGGGSGDHRGRCLRAARHCAPRVFREVVAALQALVKRDITFRNPLDLTAGASGGEFAEVLTILADDERFDAVLTIFIPPTVVDPKDAEDAVRRVAPLFQRRKKPLLACFMGERGFKTKLGEHRQICPLLSLPGRGRGGPGQDYGIWRMAEKTEGCLSEAARPQARTGARNH